MSCSLFIGLTESKIMLQLLDYYSFSLHVFLEVVDVFAALISTF
jgi:hypothetical protein